MTTRALSAYDLQRLLADRHSDGVFVPECKMGASGSRSLDAWALLATWSPFTTIGYEIKVTRSDWLRDQKFEEYRACCHLFFLVAPKCVVDKAELPAGVGLLEPIGTGTSRRLVMRVKSARQEPDPVKLSRLMAYALMWKRVEGDTRFLERSKRAEYWRRWVDEQQAFSRIAYSVKGRMRQLIHDAEERARGAEDRAYKLEEAAVVLQEMGITPGYDRYATRRRLEAALKDDTQDAVRAALSALQRVERALTEPAEAVSR